MDTNATDLEWKVWQSFSTKDRARYNDIMLAVEDRYELKSETPIGKLCEEILVAAWEVLDE